MDLYNLPHKEKLKIANNPDTAPDVLGKLAKDTNWGVRGHVAANPKTGGNDLRDLAKDPIFWVRTNVAENTNTPEEVLQELVTDSVWEVRNYVARNINISSNTLIMLYEHEKTLKNTHLTVIDALYSNANLPKFAKRVIETLYGKELP